MKNLPPAASPYVNPMVVVTILLLQLPLVCRSTLISLASSLFTLMSRIRSVAVLFMLIGVAYSFTLNPTSQLLPQPLKQQQRKPCLSQAPTPTATHGWKRMNKVFPISSATSTDNDSDAAADSNVNDKMVDCLILGGGISGSTLAHNLFYSGTTNILLAEARDYLGGNVRSRTCRLKDVLSPEQQGEPDENDDDSEIFVWEDGPNSFATQPSIIQIAHELGIVNELVFANESLPPWVYYNNKLHPLPKGNGGKGAKGQLELLFGKNGLLKFVLTSELLTWPGKIRAGIGSFIGHSPPPTRTINATQAIDVDEEDTIGSGSYSREVKSPSPTVVPVEESIQDWIVRILGNEVFERCIDPFVSGVYAGDPATLSMKSALSKIARIEEISYNISWNQLGGAIFYGGLARQIEVTKERKANPPKPEWNIEFEYGNPGSFREGLSTLPNAIFKELGSKRVKLSWKVLSVEKIVNTEEDDKDDNYYYLATFEDNSNPAESKPIIRTVRAKSVVSTLPTHALKGIFTSFASEVDAVCTVVREDINRTNGIYYPPVAAVTLAYPKTSFQDIQLPNGFGNLQSLPGFGNLNPRTQNVRTLGTLWTSSLFPNRSPSKYNLLLNYIGGSRDTDIGAMSHDEIIKEVDGSCRKVLLKDNAPPPIVLGIKVWPTAIPQYEIGHSQIIQQLEHVEMKHSGLWICGNYRTGVAFPDCVTFGNKHSQIVNIFLKNQQQQQQQQQRKEKNKQHCSEATTKTPTSSTKSMYFASSSSLSSTSLDQQRQLQEQ